LGLWSRGKIEYGKAGGVGGRLYLWGKGGSPFNHILADRKSHEQEDAEGRRGGLRWVGTHQQNANFCNKPRPRTVLHFTSGKEVHADGPTAEESQLLL